MKRIIQFITILCFLFPGIAFTQNYVGEWYQQQAEGKTAVVIDQTQPQVLGYTGDITQLKRIMRKKPDLLDLIVPFGDRAYTLNLAKVDITADGFKIKTSGGGIRHNTGVQYRGIVDGNPAHIASLNLTSTDKSAFFSTDEGNFVVTGDKVKFTVHNVESLNIPFDYCQTLDPPYSLEIQPLVVGTCKTVKVYFECDYAFYQSKGSNVTTLSNYLVGLFNQTAAIYANEGVSIQTSDIFVWTTPDPYSTMSASSTLTAFQANRGTTFNGNLAHFVSTRSPLSGIAYVDVICNKAYAYGVSRITGSYSNFPTYSWSVEVITHELGHNLGSPHTQACTWVGGAIDNCYTPEGSCAPGPTPVNGGTIMSYCHLTGTGINFNNGFGPQPGNLIRSRISNASCVASTPNAAAPTSLVTNNITSTSVTLSWAATASSYTVQYKPTSSATWIVRSASTNSLSLTGLTAATTYSWQVKSECSDYSTISSFTTSGGVPTSCLPPTSLNVTNITPTSATLHWTPPSNVLNSYLLYKVYGSYGWYVKSNIIGNSITLNYLQRGKTYQWKVKTRCTNGLSSLYSPVYQFNTLP